MKTELQISKKTEASVPNPLAANRRFSFLTNMVHKVSKAVRTTTACAMLGTAILTTSCIEPLGPAPASRVYHVLENKVAFNAGDVKSFDNGRIQVEFEHNGTIYGSSTIYSIYHIKSSNGTYVWKIAMLKGGSDEFADPNVISPSDKYYLIRCLNFSGTGKESKGEITIEKSE